MAEENKAAAGESMATRDKEATVSMHGDFTRKALSVDFLKSVTPLEKISSSPPQYLVEYQGRTFLLERHGRCDYRSCRAVCCRMVSLNLKWNEYLAGFAEKGICAPFILRACRYLADDGKCRRWKEKHFPRVCENFPVPGDPLYLEVMDRCFFSFILLQEMKSTTSIHQTC